LNQPLPEAFKMPPLYEGFQVSKRPNQAAEVAVHPDSGAPIDLVHLDRATFGDRRLRDEVLTLFLRQSAVLAATIAGAGDEEARMEAAHKLKGAALGIGAMAVAEAADVLERRIHGPGEFADALARLSVAVAAARDAASDLLGHD
jgi:HPt (histidine-containing phosphotransfer) domain-containing protein